jgi:ADP-ribose pyrophosphatase YjhB (NUDIX family)
MSQKMGFFVRKSESGKSLGSIMPLVDVVATLIMKGDRILAVYNDKWGSFSLPMTKRRSWEDPVAEKGAERVEDWEDAAIRAASEWIGCTTTQKPQPLSEVGEFQQSDRDGKWKRYHLQAYKLAVADDTQIPPARVAEWLTVDQLLDENRKPISPTARHIVSELKLAGHLR